MTSQFEQNEARGHQVVRALGRGMSPGSSASTLRRPALPQRRSGRELLDPPRQLARCSPAGATRGGRMSSSASRRYLQLQVALCVQRGDRRGSAPRSVHRRTGASPVPCLASTLAYRATRRARRRCGRPSLHRRAWVPIPRPAIGLHLFLPNMDPHLNWVTLPIRNAMNRPRRKSEPVGPAVGSAARGGGGVLATDRGLVRVALLSPSFRLVGSDVRPVGRPPGRDDPRGQPV